MRPLRLEGSPNGSDDQRGRQLRGGQATFLEKLVREMKARGYRLATIKHDVHNFNIDRPGKDSWRLTQAGSDIVLLSSPSRLAS